MFWRGVYDVRRGEGVRTLCMALHMTCILFAYYILKPLSRALFLNKFEIDQLPYLYVLIAFIGGLLAFVYTRVAVRLSLAVAVNRATASSVGCLLTIWWLLRFDFDWMLYVFNVWVSLFAIVMVSQAWLVAANVFDSREAKRLYGLLGLSAVAGAAFGGDFTSRLALILEPHDLLLAAAGMVLLAYVFLRIVAVQKGVNLRAAQGGEAKEKFVFADILRSIRRHRHLQVIMAIITITFIVDVMVEFQFSALAKAAYTDKRDLTAFLGSFYGLYLNITTFVMQFFLTSLIVRWFGVGGTLQVMPAVIALASTVTIAMPGLNAAAALRLAEAGTRYSFNRTGMELLYLPLPVELKNRTKAFVDIFMDRFGRGLGAMVLMGYLALVEADPKHPHLPRVSALILAVSICWIFLTLRVKREYIATVRRRLESRRLDFNSARIGGAGAETIALLEKTLTAGAPRQAAYALGLLADAPGYDLSRHIDAMAFHAAAECRAKAFQVAAAARYDGVTATARNAVASPEEPSVQQAALEYLAAVTPNDPVDAEWTRTMAADPAPWRRLLAASAAGLLGREAAGVLGGLLDDRDPSVAAAAFRAAGRLGDRMYVETMIRRLADSAVRGAAVEALVQFGVRICGSLTDVLADEHAPAAVRRQIPRVLRAIRDPRSVDALAAALDAADPAVQSAALKALNRLRASDPQLPFPRALIDKQIRGEVLRCFHTHAQLSALGDTGRRTPTGLLARSLRCRFDHAKERVFRLLGLCYPPEEIYNSWLALRSGNHGRSAAAHDYLDSILDREVKSIVMPLLDSPDQYASRARDLFHIEPKSAESALRELLNSGDTWLTACAMAAAAEMELKGLSIEIARAGEGAGRETVEVARAAAAALA
jgi:ATP/ADP translocase/HEAT repeat protein